jgi:hypothetical protein
VYSLLTNTDEEDMKIYIRKITTLILFLFATTSEIFALRRLGAPPAIPPAANIVFGVNNANVPLGIQAWENATFQNAANEVFNTGLAQPQANAQEAEHNYATARDIVQNIAVAIGGIGNFMTMINAMSNRSNTSNDVPHIAVARVIILDATAPNPNAYVYPIPYLFLSGTTYPNAYYRWIHANIANINNANANNISVLCKFINSYGISDAGAGGYCHSERAIGLCLAAQPLILDPFCLQNIVDYHNAVHRANRAAHVIIQIKTSRAICNGCQNFWMGDAWILEDAFCGQHAGGVPYDAFALLSHIILASLRVQTRVAGQVLGR